MADILQITLPDGTTYNIKDNNAVDKITDQSIGGIKTFKETPYHSVLYDERYQEVTYIQGNGTPYINTGKPVHMSWRYRIDFQQSDNGQYRIWGTFNQQAYNGGLNTSLTYSSGWTFRWETTNGQQREASLNTPLDAKRHVAEIINGKAYMDGLYKSTSAAHNSTVVSTYNAFLFTINPGGNSPTTTMKGKIYSYKVWDADGVLIQDMVPVYDTQASKAGLYDKCDGTFHGNANSTGAFTYGSNLSDAALVSTNELATVATSGLYEDLDGRPTFATVATSGNYNDLTNKPTISNNAVTQTATTTNSNYEILFSGTADNTTRTEGARKSSNLKFNPSTGNLQATQLNGVTIGSTPKFTDTTYTFDGTYDASTNKAATQSTVTNAINALPKRNPNGGVQKVPIDMDTSTGTFTTTITPQNISEGFTAFEESQPSFTNSSSTVLYIGEQNASENNRYKFEVPITVRYQSTDGFEFQSPIVALDSIGLIGEIGFLYLETYSGYDQPYRLTLTHWPLSSVTNVAYNSSTHNITKTINGTTSDVVTLPLIVGTGTNSAVGGGANPTLTTGDSSFAFGKTDSYSSQATGTLAVAFSLGKATNNHSFAMGTHWNGDTQNPDSVATASGSSSFAFGPSALASGNQSFAFGQGSQATATYALAIGNQAKATGGAGVALGQQSQVTGALSMAVNNNTIAAGRGSFVCGQFNIEDTDDGTNYTAWGTGAKKYAFIIGNGTATNARSNAMTVDWNGSIESGGSITLGYGGNDATTLTAAQLKTLISTGTTDQILTKTASGFAWQSLPTYNGSVS